MAKGKIGVIRYRGPGDLGRGGAEPGRTDQGEPGGLHHQEQSLRLQRQDRATLRTP